MPGAWHPFVTGAPNDQGDNNHARKRRAENDTWEVMEEQQVSPKRCRSTLDTHFGAFNGTVGKEETEGQPRALCAWQVPFSSQKRLLNAASAHLIGSTEVMRDSPNPVVEMEMDDDSEGVCHEFQPKAKTPEPQSPVTSMGSNSPEICRQLCLTGAYSPRLIDQAMQTRRNQMEGTNGSIGQLPKQEHRSSGAFGCRLFPIHTDIY